jgi:hypothetical protein
MSATPATMEAASTLAVSPAGMAVNMEAVDMEAADTGKDICSGFVLLSDSTT